MPERLELAAVLRADAVIDITELTAERTASKGSGPTDGQGADVVVEVVGHPAAIDEGLKMLAQFGRYVEIGNINMARPSSSTRPGSCSRTRPSSVFSLYEFEGGAAPGTDIPRKRNQDRLPFDDWPPRSNP